MAVEMDSTAGSHPRVTSPLRCTTCPHRLCNERHHARPRCVLSVRVRLRWRWSTHSASCLTTPVSDGSSAALDDRQVFAESVALQDGGITEQFAVTLCNEWITGDGQKRVLRRRGRRRPDSHHLRLRLGSSWIQGVSTCSHMSMDDNTALLLTVRIDAAKRRRRRSSMARRCLVKTGSFASHLFETEPLSPRREATRVEPACDVEGALTCQWRQSHLGRNAKCWPEPFPFCIYNIYKYMFSYPRMRTLNQQFTADLLCDGISPSQLRLV